MAIKPNENEVFYREVDEELRKDQMSQLFQRYGWFILGGIILLLAAVGGYIWWQNHRQAQAAEKGEALVSALDDIEAGQRQAAVEPINRLVESDISGYRAAGLFTRANLAIEANNIPAAVAALGEIINDQGLPEAHRNAALVRQVALQFDSIPPAAVIQRLRPLAQPGNPWFGSAGEMVAISHIRLNQPQQAAPIFSALARDESVPESIRSRAVQMAGALGVDAVQQSPATGGAAAQPQAQAGQPAPAAPAPAGGAATKGQGQ